MIDVNSIYEYCLWQLNKEQSGNSLSPEQFNSGLAWSNLEYFKLKYGLSEDYQAGRPVAPVTYEISAKIMDDMRSLRTVLGGKNAPALPIDVNGWAEIPPDYLHVSSIKYNGTTIEILREDFLGDRLTNSIKYPSKENPICVMQENYIQFYPKDLGFVEFSYLRLPQTPVFGYTIINDAIVYDPNTSVQSEFPQDCLADIGNLILHYAAQNLRDQLSLQTSEQRKEKGI